ncbi:MAG: ATP-binding cassette domain-containing protein [Pseudomonadota bacterium]
MNRTDAIVTLEDVHVRIGPEVVLSDINWKLKEGENWAVIGGNGAGKTTFLRLVRGEIHPFPGRGSRTYRLNGTHVAGTIGFRSKTGTVSSDLLDQYRAMGWNIRGTEVILSGFRGTAYVHRRPSGLQIERTDAIIGILGLSRLVHRRILTLSQGEAKRILIARALVHNPRLLILDEVCENLDKASRESVLETIEKAAETGTQIVYAAHGTEDLITAVTHVLKLDAGRIVAQGTKEHVGPITNERAATSLEKVRRRIEEPGRERNNRRFLIRIKDAEVYLGGERILHDLDWTIRNGENWAVLGENGSGKTTLLKLVMGEINPKHGGSIRRFGDDNPQSIWEIRRRMSLVSADLHAVHLNAQTGLQTVLSGFFGSVGLHDTPSRRQMETASEWISFFRLDSLAPRDIRTLSYGQLRMLLICRAMVTRPEILLLDEPTAGLDKSAAMNTISLVENLAGQGTCIVYVTHRQELMPGCITHTAVLNTGRITFQ